LDVTDGGTLFEEQLFRRVGQGERLAQLCNQRATLARAFSINAGSLRSFAATIRSKARLRSSVEAAVFHLETRLA
jgi:hypothetical protein